MEAHDAVRKFITGLLPAKAQAFLDGGGWWLVMAVAALVVFLLICGLVGRIWRKLFGKDKSPLEDDSLVEDLQEYAPEGPASGPLILTVENEPVQLRLVVLAPVGKDEIADKKAATAILDSLVRGLGGLVKQDKPTIAVWPPQLSHQGFVNTFHRVTKKPEREGQPSHWVLVAGKPPTGRKAIMVGLALWSDELSPIGRLNPEPTEWPRVLRVSQRK
jgi:hypothetical protein